ncbi:hypothetical protein [Paenibacillus thalictri]|uniref:Uncharacterized protein n=1 Tax=Paenibacillus thalictri TaxID=2527873 RepID=A0A4Q9DEZ3_9BACL|nr:hypothetical protein [Paenibacillus thalictri]TBL70411.1 hypothetical protein EYB31_33385 [Paenibacillus thalictri]
MIKSNVKSYKYRVGKNTYLVIHIFQTANAQTDSGNVIASNAANIKIMKQEGSRNHAKVSKKHKKTLR